MEALRPRAVDYDIRHRQYLEGQRGWKLSIYDCSCPVSATQGPANITDLKQKSHSLILAGCSPQKPLSIESNQMEVGIEGSPHSHRAGAGRLGCVEHFFTLK